MSKKKLLLLVAALGLTLGGCENPCDDFGEGTPPPVATPAADNGDPGVDDDADGFTELGGDCDDDDPKTFPDAAETCEGKDNNCNGAVNEGCEPMVYCGSSAVSY